MTRIIDAHHHLWPAEVMPRQAWRPAADAAIRRAFEGEEFAGLRAAAEVDGSVLMQSVDAADENERLLAYAQADPRIAGIVAWAPFADPRSARVTVDETLAAAEAAGLAERMGGFRCLVGTDDLDWLTTPDSVALFRDLAGRGLAWDIVPLTAAQRGAVRRLAAAVPEARIVIDHLAAPPVDGEWAEWEAAIADLAQIENAAIKLSIGVAVLDAAPAWSTGLLERASARALEAFGPDRCMAASNWPVVELRAPYARAWNDTADIVRRLCSAEEAEQVLGGVAARWYGIEETPA